MIVRCDTDVVPRTDDEGPARPTATTSPPARQEVPLRYRLVAALVVGSSVLVLAGGLWQLWRVVVPVDMGPDTGDDGSDRMFAAVALLGWVLPVVVGIVALWRSVRARTDASTGLGYQARLALAGRLATLAGAGLFVGTVLFVATRDETFGSTPASTLGGLVAATAAAVPWLADAAAVRAVRRALVRRSRDRPASAGARPNT